MKVKHTAMGKWFECVEAQHAIEYIARCLASESGHDNIFWRVVETNGLKAQTPLDLASQVYSKLPEFELDIP